LKFASIQVMQVNRKY